MIYKVLVDGAARGQGSDRPVLGAVGVVILKGDKVIGEFARGLGSVTNNEAEMEAVISGLMLCWAGEIPDPIIYSDSLMICNLINGVWACEDRNLLARLLTVRKIQSEFRFRLVHVPRTTVSRADGMANAFLNELEELYRSIS